MNCTMPFFYAVMSEIMPCERLCCTPRILIFLLSSFFALSSSPSVFIIIIVVAVVVVVDVVVVVVAIFNIVIGISFIGILTFLLHWI